MSFFFDDDREGTQPCLEVDGLDFFKVLIGSRAIDSQKISASRGYETIDTGGRVRGIGGDRQCAIAAIAGQALLAIGRMDGDRCAVVFLATRQARGFWHDHARTL